MDQTFVVPRHTKLLPAVVLMFLPVMAIGAEPTGLIAERPAEVLPEVAEAGQSIEAVRAQQQALAAWLKAETPARVAEQAHRVQITAAEIDELNASLSSGESPLKVGFVKPLERPLNVSGLDRRGKLGKETAAHAGGLIRATDDGGLVWTAAFSSPGAGGIRLHIEELSLPANAEMYFYTHTGEAYGPFTGAGPDDNNEMWTPSVMADSGILQVRIHAPWTPQNLSDVNFRVTEVGHIGPDFYGNVNGQNVIASFCSYNASCVENASCHNVSAVNDAKAAAAKMLWIAGCCIYTCSGGLIADSDSGSQIPYFLTANHCLNRQNHANNLEAFFRYQVSCGTSSCTASYTDPPSNLIAGKTTGATVVATNRTGDFTLLQLSQNPPSGSVFLGWTSTPVANSNGAVLHRISHPSGAPQSYSRQAVSTSATTCQGWPRGERIYSRDEVGATEGGSSGSPVVNASGQVVGQLSGACGFNLNDVCDSESNATVDGAFAHYFSQVEPYLAGGGGCTPTTEICNDGLDNDCDGQTDCNDSNCSGDPNCSGGCLAQGASCTANSECCSNSCKGPPSNKTCK